MKNLTKKYVLFCVTIIGLLSSCSTVRKSNASHSEQNDFAHVVKSDNKLLKSSDNTGIKSKSDSSHTLITINFDPADSLKSNSFITASDSTLYRAIPVQPIIIRVDKKGGVKVDLGDHKPSSIKIEESAGSLETDSSSAHSSESVHQSSSDSSHMQAAVKENSSSVKKIRPTALFFIGGGIVFSLLLLLYLKRKSKIINMKTLIILILCSLFLTSCTAAGSEPTDYITFGMAFRHCAGTGSYWLWIIIATTLSVFAGWKLYASYKTEGSWSAGKNVILFGIAALMLFVWLYRPCEVAANTTVEQSLRNVYIGY